MRRKIICILLLLMTSVACDISLPTISIPEPDLSLFNLNAQEKVVGSGNVTQESRVIKDYNDITLSGMGNLIFEQGDSEGIKIEAEDNLIQYIRVEVNKGKLTIGIQPGISISPTKPINYHLKIKNLEAINLTGNGSVEAAGVVSRKMTIDMSGSGHIKILNIDASSLLLKLDGSGDVDLGGKVQSQDISIDGAGNYQASDLTSASGKVNISGSGSAFVKMLEVMEVNISGSGTVHYKGSPEIKQNISGAGQIVQDK
jgi:hypothetical protein